MVRRNFCATWKAKGSDESGTPPSEPSALNVPLSPPVIQLIERFIEIIHIPTFLFFAFFLRWTIPLVVPAAVDKGFLPWLVTGRAFGPVNFVF